MNQYRIKYITNDMPDGYIASVVKYDRDEKEALGHFCGTKPDKKGFFRMKRGGVAKLESVTIEE